MPAVYTAAITFGGELELVKTQVIENTDFNLPSAFVLQFLPTQPKTSQVFSQSVGIVGGFLFFTRLHYIPDFASLVEKVDAALIKFADCPAEILALFGLDANGLPKP
jgi:hypothetical protein